jgi:hypothetical protein
MDQFSSGPDNRRATGFTNLQKYMGANKGTNLDQYIGNRIGQEGTDYQNQVQQSQNKFTDSLNDQKKKVSDEQADIDTTLQDPVKADDATVQRFAQYRNPGQYSGPNGLDNYGSLRDTAQNLNSLNQQARQPQGLLSRYLGGQNHQYTQGQQNFDRLFLGNSQGIRQGLSQLNRVTPGQLDNFQQGAQGQVQNVKGMQTDTLNSLRQRLGIDAQNQVQPTDQKDQYGNPIYSGAIGNIQNAVSQRASQFNQSAPKALNDFRTLLSGGNYARSLTPEQKAALGQAAGYGDARNPYAGFTNSSYGVNAASFLQGANPISADTAISPEEQAKLSALYKLSGAQNNFASDPTKAGTAATSPYTFNANDYLKAIQNAKNSYSQDIKPYMDVINNPAYGAGMTVDQAHQYLTNTYNNLNSVNDRYQQDRAALPVFNNNINTF